MNKEVIWKGFKKDIVVLDNIIPQEMADKFELTTTKDTFPWYLLRDIQTISALSICPSLVFSNGNCFGR